LSAWVLNSAVCGVQFDTTKTAGLFSNFFSCSNTGSMSIEKIAKTIFGKKILNKDTILVFFHNGKLPNI
jgi:hypothetical protein